MNTAKSISAVLVALAAIALLTTASPANGATTEAGRVCAQIPDVNFLRGQTSSVVATFPAQLPAGRYRVELTASDSYPDRANTDPAGQQSEQVTAFGITTPDLADGLESAEAGVTEEIDIATPFDTATITHAMSTPGINSVHPVRLCVTPVTIPGQISTATTSTTVPPATVPAAVLPDTTLPDTTLPETTLANTTLPETTLPEAPLPETPTPNVAAPALPITPAAPAVAAAPAYTG